MKDDFPYKPDHKRWGKYTEKELEDIANKQFEGVYIAFSKPLEEDK